MHRPLAGIAISALLGTWLGITLQIPPAWLSLSFALIAPLGLLAAFLHRTPNPMRQPPRLHRIRLDIAGSILICLCTVLAFWISATLCQAQTSEILPPHVDRNRATPMDVVGRVAGDPELAGDVTQPSSMRQFPMKLERVKLPGKPWKSSKGRINVRWYGPPATGDPSTVRHTGPTPAYGERWQMEGKARLNYRRKHGASSYSFSTGKRTSERLSDSPVHGIPRLLLAARKASANLLAIGIEDRALTVGVLRALLLGYRSELGANMHDLFAATGTLHIFAISGLHVGILCGLLIFLLSVLGVPRTRWILFLAPLLISYTFATGAKASAVRACMMAILYFSAPFAGRKSDSLSALALAALLIIAWSPLQLFQVGFILSFTVVVGIIVLYPLIHRGLERVIDKLGIFTGTGTHGAMPLFWEHDPAQVQEERMPLKTLRRVIRHLSSLLALSCSAWLVSAPLTAYYFGRFSPIALFANVLVIPLAFLVVLAGCLSLVLGSCAALFADIFNHANLVLVNALVQSMKILSRIPGGSIKLAKPPLWRVVLWYAVLAMGVYIVTQRRKAAKDIDNRAPEWDHDEDE